MLHIKYNSGSLIKEETYYTPKFDIDKSQLKYVSHIYADGDEAEYIKHKFGLFATTGGNWSISIPWCYKSHAQAQTWIGDIAKTILANL